MPTVESRNPEPEIRATFLTQPFGASGTILPVMQPDGHLECTVMLDEAILYPDLYLELIHVINNLKSGDVLTILFNSNGGWVETGIDLIHAIHNSKGTVVGQVIGMCASIAAVIWSACPVRKITPFGTLMFHMPSGGFVGKSVDVADEAVGLSDYFKELLGTVTKGILSEADIINIVDHQQDMFFSAATINERLQRIAQLPKEDV